MKIKSGKLDEAVNDLLNSGKMSYLEFYKTKNFIDIAKKADDYFAQKPKTIDYTELDFDWYTRFYETVGSVSDEQMKCVWAKILAQEINTPNSISYKTMDVLKNTNKQDAELFEKICRYSIRISTNAFFLITTNI